jgi:ribosomal protein S18 acetylase RimI-like enzyme
MQILPLTDDLRPATLALLRRHKETSLFLLGNLEIFGPSLGESLNSGNYKCLVDGDAVRAVFALARRGNLLAQTDRAGDYSDAILDACAEEPIAIAGFVGDWPIHEALARRHVARTPTFEMTVTARDLLFVRPLTAADGDAPADPTVRFLTPDDFAQWDAGTCAFLTESGLPVQGSVDERRADFERKVAQRHWWGTWEDGTLVSMAAFNTCVDGTGQIGGVYTVPEARRRGLSKRIMETLIADSVRVHHLESLVLFTNEDNVPAQSMYRGLGFTEVGTFALIFGQDRKA